MEQALEKCRNYDTEVTKSCKVLATIATCSIYCPSFAPTYEYDRQTNPKLAQTPLAIPEPEAVIPTVIEEGGVASGNVGDGSDVRDAEADESEKETRADSKVRYAF
jgi:hypothetical protein